MDLQTLTKAAGISEDLAAVWISALQTAMVRYHINTPLRQAHFLAQIGHESGGFKTLVENLNYSADALAKTWPTRFAIAAAARPLLPNELALRIARKPEVIANIVYQNRMGNGPEVSGDGWKYRGRGLIQLTGKANYEKAEQAIRMDLVARPERMSEDNLIASLVAGWYWESNGLNEMADRDDVLGITKRINGGTNGIDDRRTRLERAKKVLLG